MLVPDWWIAASAAFFALFALGLLSLLAALVKMTGDVNRFVAQLSLTGFPVKLVLPTGERSPIIAEIDEIVARGDGDWQVHVGPAQPLVHDLEEGKTIMELPQQR